MADIELVIKIPEEIRLALINNIKLSMDQRFIYYPYIKHAITNGIPLPKGHGDLKDFDNLKRAFVMRSMVVQGNFSDAEVASIIYSSPTIIEADKED